MTCGSWYIDSFYCGECNRGFYLHDLADEEDKPYPEWLNPGESIRVECKCGARYVLRLERADE